LSYVRAISLLTSSVLCIVFSKTPSSINARRRKETQMRLDALLARREALGENPHEVKQLAKELSGALDAELKARERENERKKKR